MPATLKEIGRPEVGRSFAVNRQVSAGGGDNRVFHRLYELPVIDKDYYTARIIEPTIYDEEYPLAVIVGQEFRPLQEDKINMHLVRYFAEVPTEWDEPIDRAITFPAVSRGSFYAAGDFYFRSAQVNERTDVRINRAYFLAAPSEIPRYDRFRVFTADGVQTTTVTDVTTPSTDEYVAMVAGGHEIVVDCVVVPWKGWIHCRETTFAVAK